MISGAGLRGSVLSVDSVADLGCGGRATLSLQSPAPSGGDAAGAVSGEQKAGRPTPPNIGGALVAYSLLTAPGSLNSEPNRLNHVPRRVPNLNSPITGPLRHNGFAAPSAPRRPADAKLDIGHLLIAVEPHVVDCYLPFCSCDARPTIDGPYARNEAGVGPYRHAIDDIERDGGFLDG